MEPTRVASFDDEMYNELHFREWFDNEVSELQSDPEYIRYGVEIENELEEQRIADSHDLSKSDFGLKSWQK